MNEYQYWNYPANQLRIARGELAELLLAWRQQLWPKAEDDPILKENMRDEIRDWRTVELPPSNHEPVRFFRENKVGYW